MLSAIKGLIGLVIISIKFAFNIAGFMIIRFDLKSVYRNGTCRNEKNLILNFKVISMSL